MVLWVVFGLLTAGVLAVLLRPLVRTPAAEPSRAQFDVRLHRDQIAELAREVERGVIGADEARAARIEIERRLLAAVAPEPAADPPPQGPSRLTAGLLLIGVPAVTLGLYLRLGSPDIPDAPHAAPARPAGDIDLEKARGQLEARLAKEPDSIEGWYYLGQADMGLGRWKDSRDAFGRALSLSNRRPDVLEAYGTMLMNEADGSVTPEAQSVFEETVSKKPDAVRARYDLALAKAQQGDIAGARALWQAMARDAPADAPWLPSVKQSIEVADRQLAGDRMPEAPAGKPPAEVAQIMTLPPSERIDAIRGMVAGLAAKLAASPDDPAGWQRLGRSYMVLNQPKDAAEAYARAAALAPGDAAAALGRAEALLAIDGDAAPLSRDTVDAFRKVLALDADQPEGLYYLGLAASQRGDTDEARQLWQRLLGRLDPAGSDAAEVGKRLAALPPAK